VLRCRTLSQSRPQHAGLGSLIGKASVSNIRVLLSFVVVPKVLARARLSVVVSPLAILASSPSRFCPLVPYYYIPLPGWHPTADHRLAPYCSLLAGIPSALWLRSPLYPPRSSHPSSLTPSRGIALPPWLPPTPWGDLCNYRCGRLFRFKCRPTVSVVFLYGRSPSSPSGPPFEAFVKLYFVRGSLPKGLVLSTCTFL